jgi:hypothetical protein
MLETMIAREEYEHRIREAEKAYRFARIRKPSRLSVAFKNLIAFVARF